MKKRVTNDVFSRNFESKLDPGFKSTGTADYKTTRRRRKTGGIGGRRITQPKQ